MKAPTLMLAAALSLMACTAPISSSRPSAKLAADKPTSITPAAPIANTAGFDQTLYLQGMSFRVSSANTGSLNQLKILPQGLKGDNAAIAKEIEGTVTGAEVADLNVDGSPEVYVYVTSAGSGSYGSLVAYAANKGRSLSEIFLPPLQDDPAASKGFMGHDQFRVVENRLVRRFPIYRDKDSNAQPSGGTRQIQYKLKAGEAGWILMPDRIADY